MKTFVFIATVVFIALSLSVSLVAQKPQSKLKVTQIDEVAIKELLKPKGKPLLVNFWATWCVPCREEFPELVEIDKEFKGKIDFITISLDDLAEINRDVPKFLKEMKAEMPAYLLKSNDENALIGSISKSWQGGLPFTVLYNKEGKIVHTKQGKIISKVVKRKLKKLTHLIEKETTIEVSECIKVLNENLNEALFYYENNWFFFREQAFKKGYISGYEFDYPSATALLRQNWKSFKAPKEFKPSGYLGNCDISLKTIYRNAKQYKNSDDNFQNLIKSLRPSGPKLLNQLKPSEFRKSRFVKTCRIER